MHCKQPLAAVQGLRQCAASAEGRLLAEKEVRKAIMGEFCLLQWRGQGLSFTTWRYPKYRKGFQMLIYLKLSVPSSKDSWVLFLCPQKKDLCPSRCLPWRTGHRSMFAFWGRLCSRSEGACRDPSPKHKEVTPVPPPDSRHGSCMFFLQVEV